MTVKHMAMPTLQFVAASLKVSALPLHKEETAVLLTIGGVEATDGGFLSLHSGE
jgi:hypothetical protein